MIQLYQLDSSYSFPPIDSALTEPNGLLAFGGDLSVGRLAVAYQQGVFPWFSQGEPILWWSPSPRAILELNQFHCSKSLKKLINKQRYRLTLNHAFDQVIDACAQIRRKATGYSSESENSTWITPSMIKAYKQLHQFGLASSVEVWDNEKLVGGLYGVTQGAVFCGESMFHRADNTSKLAFWGLVQHMIRNNLAFIDCQLENPHLSSLGCKNISRPAFLKKLNDAQQLDINRSVWQSQPINY